ncbi:MAG: hypothetical protein AMXMBFR64_53890 [Myxococcales bacterium]
MDINELRDALSAEPLNLDAFEKLQAALIDASDLAGLRELHDQTLAAADGEAQVEPFLRTMDIKARTAGDEAMSSYLYGRLGTTYWRKLDKADKAELYFRRLEGKAGDFAEEHAEFYVQFYVRRDNWRRLEQFLTEQAGNPTDSAEQVAVKRRLASIAEDAGKPDKAIVFWTGVRELLPDDDEAEQALLRLFADAGKWHNLVQLHQDRLKRVPDHAIADKIAIHMAMVAVFRDHIKSDTKVSSAYQAILEIDPGNDMALDALTEQYEGMKRWPDLVRVLQQKIAHTSDPQRLVALHGRVAQIMMDSFSNSGEAIKSYAAILEIDPTNRRAIEELKSIYEKRRDYESYLEVARKEIALEANEGKRRAAFLELARVAADKIRKPAAAIGLWEDVLGIDPSHTEALTNLEQLYEREKSYDQLTGILERRIDAAAGAERVAILEKLALVLSARLNDEDRATEVYKRILEVDPEHRKAQNELRKRYLATCDWDGLEWFFRQYGTIADFVRTLEGQVKSIDEPAERVSLLFKVADMWLAELEQPHRAIKTLEQVLAIDPQSIEAARRLAPLYRAEGDWQHLAETLEVELEGTEEPDQRQLLLLELARLYEDRLDQVDEAFFSYVQVYKENFEDEQSRRELERLASKSANWDSYVAVMEETIPRITSVPVKIETQLRAAEIYRDQLEDLDQALRHFQMVIPLDPDSRRAMDAIEDIYRRTEEWQLLVYVYKRKLDMTATDDERREVMFQLGAAWRDKLGNNEEAAKVFRDMLELFPDDARVHRELSAIYLIEEDYEGLLGVLQKELSLLNADFQSSPADVAEVQCQIAQLTYATGGDLGTVVSFYRDALEGDPTNAVAIAGLEELIGSEEVQRTITGILEPVYHDQGNWAKLADIYEIQLTGIKKKKARVGLLETLGELYRDRLGDDHRAFHAYSRIFAADSGHATVRIQLEELAEKLGAWFPLVSLYQDGVDKMKDSGQRLEVRLTLAETWYLRLEDLENAQLQYGLLLEEEPEHGRALDALEEIYQLTEQWTELLDIYRRKLVASSEPERRIEYLFRIEQTWSERIGNLGEAISAANEVLQIDPDRPAAWQRLDDLYTRAEQWEDLAGVLQERIRLADSTAETVELMGRLADVQEHRLGDADAAIETHGRILDLDPDAAGTIAALERLFEAGERAGVVAPLLEPYYLRHDDWVKLTEVYEAQKRSTEDPSRKVALDFKIADLYELKGGDVETAFYYYGFAYTTLPHREDTLDNILRLSEHLGNHADVVDLLALPIEQVEDPDRRREIHRVVARVAEEKVGDRATAKSHYRAVLEVDPGDMQATDALISLYRSGREWTELVEALRSKASLVLDIPLRKELLGEAGRTSAEELESPEQAIEIYESVLDLDPDDDAVLDALEGLYERVENWERHVWVLGRKIERSEDLDERKLYARMRGVVLDERLEALDDAVECYRQILGWDAEDLDALRALDGLFTRKGDWLDLLEVLGRMKPLSGADERADLQLRIGRTWEKELEDVYQAVEAYKELLADRPEDERALAALEAIVLEKDEREAAFEVLVPVLELLDQWERLYDLHEVMVDHRDEAFGRIKLLHRMGELAEQRLANFSQAFSCYARAFKEDVERADTVAELERLAGAHGLWEDLQALYQEGAEGAADPMRGLEYRLRAAAILKDGLGDFDRALALYAALREDYPDNRTVLLALDELYSLAEDWAALQGVLQAQIESTPDVAEKTRLLFRMGDLCEDKLGDDDAAFEAYQEVHFLRPDDAEKDQRLWRLCEKGSHRLEIADLLEPLFVDRADWTSLHRLLELKLLDTTDVLDRGGLLRRLAELNIERLDRPVEAMGWYGQALAIDPSDDFVLAQLELLADLTNEWNLLVELELRGAQAAEEDERKIEVWHKAAAVCRDRLADGDRAEALFTQILALDDENQAALGALDAMYEGSERWTDLMQILSRRIAVAEYEDDQVRMLARLGELWRDRLDNWDEAIGAYGKILDLDEAHLGALRALAAMYEIREEWPHLFDVFRKLVLVVTDEDERVELLERMADIAEERLARPAEAIELWEEVLANRPDSRAALLELERLLEAGGKWEPLVDAFERELGLLGRGEDQNRVTWLHRRLGQLWRDTLEDSLRAQSHWEAVLEQEPADLEALVALRAIYRNSGAIEALVDVVERLVLSDAFAGDELRDLWIELAELRGDMMGQPTQAIEAWERVAELDPAHDQALDSLERLYTDQGRWADTVTVLQRKAGRLDAEGNEAEATDLLMRVAGLQVEQLGDPRAAMGTLATVLQRDPAHLDASMQLEHLYEAAGAWEELSELLLARVEQLPEAIDRVSDLHRLAKVFEEKLSDTQSAFLVHQRALDEIPDDLHTLAELERLATAGQMWAELADIWNGAIPKMEDPTATEYRMKLGVLVRDELDRLEEAVGHFRQVLAADPEHEGALKALVELYALLESWPELIETLGALGSVIADYQERTRLAVRIGEVWEHQLYDIDQAIKAYQAVLDLDEMEDRALSALERLFEGRKQWKELIEILELRGRVHAEEETAYKLRVGEVWEKKLGKPERAIEVYEDVLNAEPGNQAALSHLEALYGERNDWDGLVEVYQRLLSSTDKDSDRITICRNLAMLREEIFKEPEAAADFYHQILGMEPMNEDALENLERIYEGMEAWEELLQTLERHAEIVTDDGQRVDLLTRVALVHRDRVHDLDNAIRTYERILDIAPDHGQTLDALEMLYRENELWEQVVDVLDRKLRVATGLLRTELHCQKAEVFAERMLAPDRAVGELDRALREDPHSLRAVRALQGVHATAGDWELVVSALMREHDLQTADADKAEALNRVAEVYRDKLLNQEKAVHAYERALETLPDFTPAALALSEIYIRQEKWARAEPLLSVLVRKVETEADDAKAAELYFLIGQSAENLLDTERAIDAYGQALRRRPSHVPTVKGLARLSLKKERYEQAERYYLDLVDRMVGEASDQEMVEVYMALGEIALTLGKDDRASEYLEKALDLQPNNAAAVSNLIQLAELHKNWGGVVRYQKAMLDIKTDPIERLALQLTIGDLYKDKLGDIEGAIESYRDALDIDRNCKPARIKLLSIFMERKKYEDALDVLRELADAEDEPARKAQYFFTIGVIYRDQLHDTQQAIHYLDMTLDIDPSRLEAFAAIDELLTQQRAWKDEERAYRRMIERLAGKGNTELEFKLYRGLGEIYRSRLKDLEYAIPAFELASERKPDDTSVHEILAEMYELAEGQHEKAIEAHRRLVTLEPDKRIGSYKALFRLNRETGDPDGAWNVAGILTALGQADEEMSEYYEEHRDPGMAELRRPLDAALWQKGVFSPDEDLLIGQVFQILYQALGDELRAKDLKELDLKKKDELKLSEGTLFANVFSNAVKALNVSAPRVFVSSRLMGLRIENLNPVAVVIGNDMLSGKSEKELAFTVAKALTYFLPMHVMAAIYSRPDLKVLFLAAMKVSFPDFPLQAGAPGVAELVAEIDRKLSPGARIQLRELLEKARDPKRPVDLNAWLNHVEMSANHAGLLLANDFQVVLTTMRNEPFTLAKLPPKDKVKDLVLFSISERYAALRLELGLAVEG